MSADRSPALSYLFVVTYGRSGSTLLMGLLNSIPGYLVRGENGDAVYHLYQFHRTLMKQARTPSRAGASERRNAPWFGIDAYKPRVARRRIRRLVEDSLLLPEPETRVTGFKEIRWDKADLLPYLRFLQKTFPGARFVMNVRNLQDVQQSKWWQDVDPAVLDAVDARIRSAAEAMGDDGYLVRYDDYIADPVRLRGLFDWLGEPFDLDQVTRVLEIKHSY